MHTYTHTHAHIYMHAYMLFCLILYFYTIFAISEKYLNRKQILNYLHYVLHAYEMKRKMLTKKQYEMYITVVSAEICCTKSSHENPEICGKKEETGTCVTKRFLAYHHKFLNA